MIKLRPLTDRVIIQQDEAPEESEGGIALAMSEERPLRGTVIQVGPGRWLDEQRIEPVVKPGDVVLFGKNAGDSVELDRETTVLVMHEREILAVLDD
jgi:chaperonin GroES